MPLTARQAIELFQLVFLRALVAKGEDKSLFVLKGGCNLRFFFGSLRYSEDIDLDVAIVRKDTLKNKVERLLQAPTVVAPLAARDIELVDVSAPKQTDTTQRWKAGLRVKGLSSVLRTRIEFSRRRVIAGAEFESIAQTVLRPYGLTPFLATHYLVRAAVVQKIQALADRSAPQARDLFDLNLLFALPDAHGLELSEAEKSRLPEAIEHGLSFAYDEYASQVVAYLEPAQAELFATRSAWGAIQKAVIERLEALA